MTSSKQHSDIPETVGVVGLGLLGRGIATCLLGHGLRVVGYTRSDSSHETARRSIEQGIGELVDQAHFEEKLRQEWPSRYQATQDLEALRHCDFVIESVVEDLQLKVELFDRLEQIVAPSVPVASNTSAIPINALQTGLIHPRRFLGMHWAEPAHATRFLELIRGEETSDEVVTTTLALARLCGKEPSLLNKDIPGFIVNRLAYAMYCEALHLVESGVADVETIDRSFRNAAGLWATMCGPFRWMDLTGGPAAYARAMKPVLPTLARYSELPETLEKLADDDARGIADGHGFYQYTPRQAEQAEALFRQHAWRVRGLLNEYFPLEEA